MKLVLGTAGFDVTQYQLKLRRLYPNAQITGRVDELTIRLTRGLCQSRGVSFDGTITSEICALFDQPSNTAQRTVCVKYSDSRERALSLTKALAAAGVDVIPSGSPKIFVDDDVELEPGAVIFYRFKSWPLDAASLGVLNQAKLVVVGTPFEAFCLHQLIAAKIRVIPLGIDTQRYFGANTSRFTVGYHGSRPDEIARIFQQAVAGSKYENRASLVCSEPIASVNPSVTHVPIQNAAEWLAPLTCLISARTACELHSLAAAVGKLVLVPAVSLPDHGLTQETGVLVDSAFYSDSKPVLGLQFSQDALVHELSKLASDPECAVTRGLAAAQANKLAVTRLTQAIPDLMRHLAVSP